ncbi:hypothetical protein JCM6882_003179 [Rhodosporidiobolus microsporus]
MPPPPPPPPPLPPAPLAVPPNPTTDDLLRILEGANPSLSTRPAPSSSSSSLDPSFHSSPLDDLAASSLANRHASRRERELELEWDEQDNARRARALLDRLFPGEGGGALPQLHHPLLDPIESDDDDLAHDVAMAEADEFHAALGGGGAFPPSLMGLGGSGEDDEDEDGRILGFDGDPYDDDFLGDDGYGSDFPGAYEAQTHDLAALWPGFLGQRPLNPPSSSFSSSSSFRPTSSSTSALPHRSLPRDPSSATSYTSFLAPGTVFLGEQTFGQAELAASWASRNAGGEAGGGGAAHASYAAAVASSSSSSAIPTSEEAIPITRPRRSRLPPPVPPPLPTTLPAASNAPPSPIDFTSFGLPPPASTHATTAHPAFAPFPPSSSRAVTESTRLPSPLLAAAAQPPSHPGPSSSLAIPRPPTSSSSFANPQHSSFSSSASDRAAAARDRISQSVNPAARSSRSSWREVEEEMVARVRRQGEELRPVSADQRRRAQRASEERYLEVLDRARRAREEVERVVREAEGEVPAAAGRGAGVGAGVAEGEGKVPWREQEQWRVKVIIQSYKPEDKLFTGVMRAHGVAPPHHSLTSSIPSAASPSSPPAPLSDVLTHFTGHILDPLHDGLFASSSPLSSLLFRTSPASESSSWVQLGPFKGLSQSELLSRAKSREWCEERARGWVLFRLKEDGFVNVTEEGSALSIAGFYHCCLNRATGAIEGLYSDPTATPFQRLALSATSETGAFSSGSFAMC